MKRKQWKAKIRKACESAGTYQPFFDPVIDTLAGIMEIRDRAEEQYISMGGNPIGTHTNKSGAVNVVKNPALVAIMECNAQALAYWKELGLTSRAFKSMTGGMMVTEREKSLEDILAEL